MAKIVKVTPYEDYTLEIELNNCHKIIYDMKPRLGAVRFYSLANPGKFKDIQVTNGDTLVWDSLCQITISEIISQVER